MSKRYPYTLSYPASYTVLPSLHRPCHTPNLTLHPNRQDWACEACFAIYPLYPAILQYTIEILILDANILRDSILVRLEMVTSNPLTINLTQCLTMTMSHSNPNPYPCRCSLRPIMWRVVYREFRAVTNDATLALNPMELNDIYDHLWDVATLLTSADCLTILDEGFRPWPKIHHGSEKSWDLCDIHERHKATDLAGWRDPVRIPMPFSLPYTDRTT
jgi:hypothetical protein